MFSKESCGQLVRGFLMHTFAPAGPAHMTEWWSHKSFLDLLLLKPTGPMFVFLEIIYVDWVRQITVLMVKIVPNHKNHDDNYKLSYFACLE